MSLVTDLIGLGMPPEQASALNTQTISSGPTKSVSAGLTATGTNLATALQLTSLINVLSTVGSGTGVKLPDVPIGQFVLIQNNGANTLNVFPIDASGTLNGGTAGAAVTCQNTIGNIAFRQSATNWLIYALSRET
jgi:hypothetical protein